MNDSIYCFAAYSVLMEKQKLLTPFNYCQPITESQKKSGLEGASRGHLIQSPIQSTAKLTNLIIVHKCNFESLQEHRPSRFYCLTVPMLKHQDDWDEAQKDTIKNLSNIQITWLPLLKYVLLPAQ